MSVYLDYNATTPVRPEAIEAMTKALAKAGNPSSVHAAGRAARAVVEEARAQVAALIAAPASTVVFTSGGTEANALAIDSAVLAGSRQDMAAVMAEADLAVASFCVTAYELATVGVPGIYLCLSSDHAEAALAFVEVGIGISLGVHTQVTVAQLAERVESFLRDPGGRLEMSQKSRASGKRRR